MSLTFDEASHTYRWNGVVVPGVTEVLKPLQDFAAVRAEVLEAAAAFGTAVHKACELDDLGELDEATLDPALVPYLEQWRRFCADHGCRWEWVEGRFFHPKLRYAGTADRIGRVNDERAVLDIKSSAALYPAVGPQTAAYARAYDPDIGASLKRYGLRLSPDSYELKAYANPADWSVFCSLLTLREWCAQHRVTPNLKELSHV